MKRVMTGLAVAATSLVATVAFAGSAHADVPHPPGVPANYVLYKSITGGVGECNSAGVSFEQEGLITAFICDNVQPPTPTSGGYSNLWALLRGTTPETFALPAGANAVKVAAGSTHVTVTRSARLSPNNAIPCSLSVTNPAYNGSGVAATATIHCAYPTNIYIQVGLTYNGGSEVYNSASVTGLYSASTTVTRTANPGYYQADTVAVLGDGEQYGYYYSSNVYIPQ